MMAELSDTTGGWIVRGFAQGLGTIAAYALVLWLLSKVEEKPEPMKAQIVEGYPQLSYPSCSSRVSA
jgi:hypothetical protein